MKIRIVAAGAAISAGLIMSTPAWAVCIPLWGTLCRPATTPSTDAATDGKQAKPDKPLNLRKVAHKGAVAKRDGKRVRIAARRRPHVAARSAHRSIRVAHSRRGAKHRLASTRRRLNLAAAERTNIARAPEAAVHASDAPAWTQLPSVVNAPPANTPESVTSTNGFSTRSTDGALAQDQLTALDLAADTSKPGSQTEAADAPRVVADATITGGATNAETSAVAPSSAVTPAPAPLAASPAAAVAPPPSNPIPTTVAAAPAQQPAEESSWLRRIIIGLGGVLTLASAVRLFAA